MRSAAERPSQGRLAERWWRRGSRRQRPDIFLQQRPGFVAGHLLHVRIEPGLRQHLAERLGVRRIERQPLARQVLPLARRHRDEDVTLLDRNLGEIAVAHLLQVRRQLLPCRDVE